MVSSSLPLQGVAHGERIIVSIIEDLARTEPDSPWISVPVDDSDVSKGYTDITYGQLDNAANHAAHWLRRNLPATSEPFQLFAYAGFKDMRYAILALAAGKLGKVVVFPSTIITQESHLHILSKTGCSIFVRDDSMASAVDELVKKNPSLNVIAAPQLSELLTNDVATPVPYPKSWAEGKEDPWMYFHTSGTTGHPKPIKYTHRMLAIPDFAASLKDVAETHIHHYARRRWYCPMPMLHFVGMLMVLSMTSCVRTVVVLGPNQLPPIPSVVKSVLQNTRVDGALLAPAQIDALCLDPTGLETLRTLSYVHYVGAPLGIETGQKISSQVHVVPSIGSTEAGGYFIKIRSARESEGNWDYVEFQLEAGAVFEPRQDGLHELVFVRSPQATIQQIFQVFPEKDRHETNDLWIEHPTLKNHWKIVSRADDYVAFTHGEGLHASSLEPELERCELIQAALIGGHGKPGPVLLVELVPSARERLQNGERDGVVEELRPYVEKVNEKCHESVKLSLQRLIFVDEARPFVRTTKGSVGRAQSLKVYEQEIDDAFR